MTRKGYNITLWILCIMVISSCSNQGNQLREDATNALRKPSSPHYTFNGSLETELHMKFGDIDEKTLVMVQALQNSQIEFQGQTSEELLKSEAELTVAMGDMSWTMPIIVDQELLYFKLPLPGQDEKYFSMPIDIDMRNQAMKSSDTMKQLLETLLSNVKGKWFHEADAENEGWKRIEIEISDQSKTDLLLAMKNSLPTMLQTLEEKEWINNKQSEQLSSYFSRSTVTDALRSIELKEPGVFALTLDEQGILRMIQLQLQIIDPQGTEQGIALQYEVTPLNSTPEFAMQIPENVQSFEDILLLMP